MSFRTFWQNKILDHLFGKSAYSPPTIYVGLIDVISTEEPVGNGYQRVATVPADWTVSSGGAMSNANKISFPMATGSWGLITKVTLYDAISGGNKLAEGISAPPQAVTDGKVFSIAAGNADLTLD